MFLLNPYRYGGPFIVDAADFDGTSYLSRAALVGAADSAKITFSAWFNARAANGFIFGAVAGSVFFTIDVGINNGYLIIDARNAANTTVLTFTGTAPGINSGWHHMAASIDLTSTLRRSVYLDGVPAASPTWATYVNSTIGFSAATVWSVGCVLDGSPVLPITGCIAELAVWPNFYLDLSDASVLAKLYSAAKPVNMGSSAFIPTGTAAAIYMHLVRGESANDFALNRGTGGDFSVTSGDLATCATSPSG